MSSIHGHAYKITDNKGGVRVVVAQPDQIKNHITATDVLILKYNGILHDPIDPGTIDYIFSISPESTNDVVIVVVNPIDNPVIS